MKTTARVPVRRWPYLLVGFFLLLALGLIYAWSVIGAPVADQFAWSASQASFVFTVSMVFFCVGGIFGSVVSQKVGICRTLLLAATCMLAGCLLTAFMTSHLGFCLAYGVLCGTGVGIAYNVLLGRIGAWYPDKPGLCSSVLLTGFGLGGHPRLRCIVDGDDSGVAGHLRHLRIHVLGPLNPRCLHREAPWERPPLPSVSGERWRDDSGAEMTTRQMVCRLAF